MNKTALKSIASALRSIAKNVEGLELAPSVVFDADTLAATLAAAQLPAAAIEKMIDTARKAHEKEHGDGEAQNRKTVYDVLNDGLKAILDAHNLAKSPRRQTVAVTASAITADQCREAIAKRATGIPLSVISRDWGSDDAAQNLRNAIEREGLTDELAKANEAAKKLRAATVTITA